MAPRAAHPRQAALGASGRAEQAEPCPPQRMSGIGQARRGQAGTWGNTGGAEPGPVYRKELGPVCVPTDPSRRASPRTRGPRSQGREVPREGAGGGPGVGWATPSVLTGLWNPGRSRETAEEPSPGPGSPGQRRPCLRMDMWERPVEGASTGSSGPNQVPAVPPPAPLSHACADTGSRTPEQR